MVSIASAPAPAENHHAPASMRILGFDDKIQGFNLALLFAERRQPCASCGTQKGAGLPFLSHYLKRPPLFTRSISICLAPADQPSMRLSHDR